MKQMFEVYALVFTLISRGADIIAWVHGSSWGVLCNLWEMLNEQKKYSHIKFRIEIIRDKVGEIIVELKGLKEDLNIAVEANPMDFHEVKTFVQTLGMKTRVFEGEMELIISRAGDMAQGIEVTGLKDWILEAPALKAAAEMEEARNPKVDIEVLKGILDMEYYSDYSKHDISTYYSLTSRNQTLGEYLEARSKEFVQRGVERAYRQAENGEYRYHYDDTTFRIQVSVQ